MQWLKSFSFLHALHERASKNRTKLLNCCYYYFYYANLFLKYYWKYACIIHWSSHQKYSLIPDTDSSASQLTPTRVAARLKSISRLTNRQYCLESLIVIILLPLDHFQINIQDVPGIGICCDEHDYCYDTCNSDKVKCDKDFKECLYGVCKDLKKKKNSKTDSKGGKMCTAYRVFSCCFNDVFVNFRLHAGFIVIFPLLMINLGLASI